MSECDNTVDIGKVRERAVSRERIALERICDQAGNMGTAVHGCENADVVARRHASVGTDDSWNVAGSET